MSIVGQRITASAPAKTNLALHVAAPREDGYHPLETLFLALGLRDLVSAVVNTRVALRGPGVTVSVEAEPGSVFAAMLDAGVVRLGDVPLDGSNLAVRAALAVCEEYGHHPGLDLHITKAIPVAGGMGGGSADAAAALVAVNEVLARHLGREPLGARKLQDLGARLGADVPFMVHGGLAVGRDNGAELHPVETTGHLHLVVVPQEHGLSTPAVYRRWDEHHVADAGGPQADTSPDPLPAALLEAAAGGDPTGLPTTVRNDLQAAAIGLYPDLERLLNHGVRRGALAGWVSGSGPTVCFLAADAAHAVELAEALRREHMYALAVSGPAPGARIDGVEGSRSAEVVS